MTIDELRERIDVIDGEILSLLNQRARCAVDIGHIKATHGRAPFVPAREIRLLQRLEEMNRGPLAPRSVRSIFREIISACLNLERPISIAYLGPPATQTQIAAHQQFGASAEYVPTRSIADVFAAVETSRQDFGVVPVENSTAGSVPDTLDNFVETPLTIVAEVLLPIHFSLLSRETELGKIKRVFSIPIATEQCRRWLDSNLPEVEIVDSPATARAAQQASEEDGAAAIASRAAADLYGLTVLHDRIEDNCHNTTRFLVLGHHGSEPSGRDKTSLMFAVSHQPGRLNAALECLEQYRINLTMINSRPTKRMPWEYVFFVDIQGHTQDENVKAALDAMRERSAFTKVLGSYPEASTM
jgi:chorismate mutase / prephenate dehydratase